MDPIAERVRWIVDHRFEGNARAFARAAALPSETHVGLILERGAQRTAGTVLAKLASAGGVHLLWLIDGTGPRDVEPAGDGYRVEYDARYPNLQRALEQPLMASLDPRTVRRVQRTSFASPRDLTIEEWVRHIISEDDRVRRGFADDPTADPGEETGAILERTARERPELGPPPPKWPGGRRPKK